MTKSLACWIACAVSAQDMRAPVSVDMHDAPVERLLDVCREVTGLSITLEATVRERKSCDELRVTMRLRDVPARTALKLALEPMGLTGVWRDGGVLILTTERARTPVTRVYYIADVAYRPADFPVDPLPEICPCGSDPIGDLVLAHTGGRTWQESYAALQVVNGLLVVTQSSAVHAEIRALLARLRKAP